MTRLYKFLNEIIAVVTLIPLFLLELYKIKTDVILDYL